MDTQMIAGIGCLIIVIASLGFFIIGITIVFTVEIVKKIKGVYSENYKSD